MRRMTVPTHDTFRPVAALFELPTPEGVILVLDKRGRSAAEVTEAVQQLVDAAREPLSGEPGVLDPHEKVFSEWWRLGFDSALGHLSPAWNLYLLAPAQPLSLTWAAPEDARH